MKTNIAREQLAQLFPPILMEDGGNITTADLDRHYLTHHLPNRAEVEALIRERDKQANDLIMQDHQPNPAAAWVQNNGGFAPPTANLLCLPDGSKIPFPLSEPTPLYWALRWLAENQPSTPLHPVFVVTM